MFGAIPKGGCAEVGVGHGLGAHPKESELYEPHRDARGHAHMMENVDIMEKELEIPSLSFESDF